LSLRFRVRSQPGSGTRALARLYDLRGNLIRKSEFRLPVPGSADLRMETESVPTGIYVAALESGRERIIARVWIP
jgi:hypothetical protein